MGRDGLLRTRAGGGAGFEVRFYAIEAAARLTTTILSIQLDDELEETVRDFVRLLRLGADTLEAQVASADRRFLENALSAGRAYARAAQHHENCRTVPVTNAAGSSNTIRFRYTSSSGS